VVSELKLYVEGGNPPGARVPKDLTVRLRQALGEFVAKALGAGAGVSAEFAGGRSQALSAFVEARRAVPGAPSILLVDSERAMPHPSEEWQIPSDLTRSADWDQDVCEERLVHLMVEAMEAWFLSDRGALRSVFPKLDESGLPDPACSEALSKADHHAALSEAADTGYSKTKHSPKLLAALDPATVRRHCAWCERFLGFLESELAAS
jgi:hypothetical protein